MPARMPRRLLDAALPRRSLAAGAGRVRQRRHEAGRRRARPRGPRAPLDGIDYNVFITRELNPRITPDKAYVDGPEAPTRRRRSTASSSRRATAAKDAHQTADRFKIVDNQGNEFEPEPLPADNDFAYHAAELDAERVHPRGGQRRPARPDGRLDAAVPAAAREHREPPARARDRGPGRRAPHVRARHLGSAPAASRARRRARRAPPARPSRRRRPPARASPPPRSSGAPAGA